MVNLNEMSFQLLCTSGGLGMNLKDNRDRDDHLETIGTAAVVVCLAFLVGAVVLVFMHA